MSGWAPTNVAAPRVVLSRAAATLPDLQKEHKRMDVETDLPARRVNGRMWMLGQSGNPAGRPIGARGRFSQQFIADLTNAWEQ